MALLAKEVEKHGDLALAEALPKRQGMVQTDSYHVLTCPRIGEQEAV